MKEMRRFNPLPLHQHTRPHPRACARAHTHARTNLSPGFLLPKIIYQLQQKSTELLNTLHRFVVVQ